MKIKFKLTGEIFEVLSKINNMYIVERKEDIICNGMLYTNGKTGLYEDDVEVVDVNVVVAIYDHEEDENTIVQTSGENIQTCLLCVLKEKTTIEDIDELGELSVHAILDVCRDCELTVSVVERIDK